MVAVGREARGSTLGSMRDMFDEFMRELAERQRRMEREKILPSRLPSRQVSLTASPAMRPSPPRPTTTRPPIPTSRH